MRSVVVIIVGSLLLVCPLTLVTVRSQVQTGASRSTGVLRLRVRVKMDEATKGLSRKRFYLIKGTKEQNKAVATAVEQQQITTRDCFYSKLGASQALIDWLRAGDCESVYCREVEPEYVTGPKAVPEFAVAFAEGEKDLGSSEVRRKWLPTNIPAPLRDGFYKEQRGALQNLVQQAETVSGATVLSVMTDRNGTAYFTDLEPGTYVLTNLLPVELGPSAATWNCEVQIKAGDIATEKPYLVSNRQDRNVKCVAVEKPLPVCTK